MRKQLKCEATVNFDQEFLEVNMILGDSKRKGKMTVQEAGRKGGEKTAQTHGREFYSEIGSKGGQTVRRLIREGKEREQEAAIDG